MKDIKDLLLQRETFYRCNEDGSFSQVDLINEFYEDIELLLEEARKEGYRSGLEDEMKRGEIYHNLAMADEGLMHEAELEEARKEGRKEIEREFREYRLEQGELE